MQELKTLPNDSEAEQAVICSMLFDKDAVALAHERLTSVDFYRPDYSVVYDAMTELFVTNEPIDIVTLKNKLETKNMFEKIGGTEFLSALANNFYTSANIKQYIAIVESKSILRKLIKIANEISSESFAADKDVEVILETAEKKIFNVIQNRHSNEFCILNDILVDAIDNIESICNNKITGLSTGFIDFDGKTAGLQKSDLILIAARPSMGKTAFALNIAQYVGVHKQLPLAIFSLEMSKQQLANRLLCAQAMIDAQKLRTGQLEQDDWGKIAEALAPLSSAPIYIDDTPGITAMELRAKCRKLKLEKNIQLVIIDYLQLMSGSGNSNSRQQEISDISRALKGIAREIDVPVIALSQLSRACEMRADHRPMLSDLRESGAIEQDADVVAFLYRDEYYNPDTEKKNQAEIIIAKQRNGPTGTVDLVWLSSFTKFQNMLRE